jgi:hypothetical protein
MTGFRFGPFDAAGACPFPVESAARLYSFGIPLIQENPVIYALGDRKVEFHGE